MNLAEGLRDEHYLQGVADKQGARDFVSLVDWMCGQKLRFGLTSLRTSYEGFRFQQSYNYTSRVRTRFWKRGGGVDRVEVEVVVIDSRAVDVTDSCGIDPSR
jgi:hypothetical protein